MLFNSKSLTIWTKNIIFDPAIGQLIIYKVTDNLSDRFITIKPSKLQNVVGLFWDRWRRESLVNLPECHKINEEKLRKPAITEGDIVITEEPNLPRSAWRLAKMSNRSTAKMSK